MVWAQEWVASVSAVDEAVLIRAAEEVIRRRAAESSMHEFMKQAWSNIEPGYDFSDNWHIGALCEHLEAVHRGEIRNLMINVPPRSGKTNICSVAFPAWCWIREPSQKFIFGSYAYSLALDASIKCRQLIKSTWYQNRWGEKVSISADRDTKDYYVTGAGGERIITSVDALLTGRGADIFVCLPRWVMLKTDIGDVSIGDIVAGVDCRVLSLNHETGDLEYKEIDAREDNDGSGKDMLEIELESGEVLTCTEDHPVWIEGRGYVEAIRVAPGDKVRKLR